MKRSPLPAAVPLLLALLFVPAAARGEEPSEQLSRARAEFNRLDFVSALKRVDEALASGRVGPGELANLYALRAELYATTGYPDSAVTSFGRALELFPAMELPPHTSPKILQPFNRARARLKSRRLTAVPSHRFSPDDLVTTSVQVEGDVFQLVDRGTLHAQTDLGFEVIRMVRTEALSASWRCEAPPCRYYVTLHDGFGNTLVELGTKSAPLVALRPAAVPTPTPAPAPAVALDAPLRPSRAWYQRPAPYLVFSGAMGLTTAYLGFRFHDEQSRLIAMNQQRSSHYFEQARALDSARKLDHTLMWVGLGLTVVSSVAGTLMW